MVRKVGGTRKRKPGPKKHHRTTRRRRVSGANDMSGMLMKAGGLIVGAVAARELNTLVVKFFPSFSPLMSGVTQVAAGFVLPKFVKGPFFADMGAGMIANGGMVTIVATGLISGVGDRMAYRINGGSAMNGTGNLQVVNGTGMLPIVNGIVSPSFATVAGGSPNFSVVNGPQTRISNNPIPGGVQRPFNTFV